MGTVHLGLCCRPIISGWAALAIACNGCDQAILEVYPTNFMILCIHNIDRRPVGRYAKLLWAIKSGLDRWSAIAAVAFHASAGNGTNHS